MRLALVGLIMGAMGLSGCGASTAPSTTAVAYARPMNARVARMLRIEQEARMRGVQGIWVHPPDPNPN
jgi:hypothetical protein